MAEDMGSTVPRRQLGRALRQLRTEAGVTLDAAAEALECSRQKVWRIESGLGSVRSVDVRAMCQLYDANPELTGALVALASETKAKGWWHAYGDAIPDWFELYVGLEQAASRLREYGDALMPGLLQTREYARAVYQHRAEVTDEERDRLVDVRLQRQSLLRRRLPPPPRFDVVLSEAVLLRTVGNRIIMASQLRHLLTVGQEPHISIRVLPLSVGLHRGVEAGAFVILEFPPGNRTTPEPPVVYSESWTGALYLDRPEEFAAYGQVWSSLKELALDRGQSAELINKIAGEVHHG
ncbi:helix-turn-helix domain-containing protein [Micromonospora sagamiensis]|uniref:Helix-turn-helix protein n=1 Tax=Micromonospora sagamiensis TaxID=47875 RepID=A0A562WKW8_9ACTN|nr:helix-turn-helix transcriptional regulator [Micromonospora sagamiensis]TWJ30828.1 helix-turn-helix protein [Micromonospora sagamiensis]BCL16135.1 transcriptional regulator [Micromonospora sagamiensis]